MHAYNHQSGKFENDIASQNSPKIKTPCPKLMILVSFYSENNFLPNKITCKTNDILSMMSLKLRISAVALFLAHPVYMQNTYM